MIDTFFIFGAKYLYVVIVVVALIYFNKQTKDQRREIAVLGMIALPVMYAIAKIISIFYYSTLPFVEGDFAPLILHEADNGFPSDHTLLAAGISSVFYFFNKKLSAVLWMITLVVGVSRVYVGVHHSIDIAGSIIIAIAITILMYILISRWKKGIIGKMK